MMGHAGQRRDTPRMRLPVIAKMRSSVTVPPLAPDKCLRERERERERERLYAQALGSGSVV
jgi:hypothetical protein